MSNEKLDQKIDSVKNLLKVYGVINADLVDTCTMEEFLAGYLHGSMSVLEKVLEILEDK